jgi:nucleotide-binding universal stress UspA family protein
LEGFRLTLLSVVDHNEDVARLTESEALDRETNVLRTYLHEIAADLQKFHNIQAVVEVIRGNPAEEIQTYMQREGIDLLVVSTHGRSGISRWRLGSVADKLIRSTNRQTLVVGPLAGDEEGWLELGGRAPFQKILLPVDGSELAEQVFPTVQRFATAFGSEVHVVRVIGLAPYASMEASYTPELFDSLDEAAKDYVARVAAGIVAPGGVRTQVLMGSPAVALEDYVEKAGIDLVVMTTHGRGGITRTALGSVADRMIGGKAPVLVIRAS